MLYTMVILFSIMNFTGLWLMKMDKQKAVKHQYRIKESTLWTVALLGGAIGSTLGMNLYRHKTKHFSFKYGFPLLSIIQAILYIILFYQTTNGSY
jgi:uncharacterized membrane protein YsdA (DUF1294 family)